MRLSRAALPLLAAVLARAADPLPADLFPAGTRILIGVSLRSIAAAPILQGLSPDAAKVTSSITAFGPFTGVDPSRDLDTVYFGTTGAGEDAPGILILRGRFPTGNTKDAEFYHGIPTFRSPQSKEKDVVVALLDSATVIAGRRADVEASIDRRGGPTAVASQVASRFDALAADFDFWGAGSPPEGFKSASAQSKDLESVDRFEFGASLRQGLKVQGEVHLRSPEAAKQMSTWLAALSAASKSRPSPEGVKFDLRLDHGAIKVSLFVPDSELKKAIVAQKDAMAGLVQKRLAEGFGIKPPVEPGKVVTNDRGETVKLVLPGGRQ